MNKHIYQTHIQNHLKAQKASTKTIPVHPKIQSQMPSSSVWAANGRVSQVPQNRGLAGRPPRVVKEQRRKWNTWRLWRVSLMFLCLFCIFDMDGCVMQKHLQPIQAARIEHFERSMKRCCTLSYSLKEKLSILHMAKSVIVALVQYIPRSTQSKPSK